MNETKTPQSALQPTITAKKCREMIAACNSAAHDKIEKIFHIVYAFDRVIEEQEAELKRLRREADHWKNTVLPVLMTDGHVEKQEVDFSNFNFGLGETSFDLIDNWDDYLKLSSCISREREYFFNRTFTVRLAHEVHASVKDSNWLAARNVLHDLGLLDKVVDVPATWKIHNGTLKSIIKMLREGDFLDDEMKKIFSVHEYETVDIRALRGGKNNGL